MNDEHFQRAVGAWLSDEDPAPPDSLHSARQVAARLPLVRQQSRWWPLPLLRRTPTATPTPTDTIEYQPSPIPASNGHTPTTIGRTSSMLSPVKAITAGALVFAIGGAFLSAQPFDQQGSVPGATTDEGPAAPVAVTATNAAGSCGSKLTTERIGIVKRTLGYACEPHWDWSDDRLDGTVTFAWNEDVYSDGSGLSIGMLALSFENDAGAWRMRPLPQLEFPDAPEIEAETWILDGEGDYDGLTAVLVLDGFEPHGFIIDGDLPPAPENASTK